MTNGTERKRGAPRGNCNALKHGRFSAETIARRKEAREMRRQARHLLLLASILDATESEEVARILGAALGPG